MPFPSALPEPRTPDPRTAPALRWGVLGTGWIAERFTSAVHRNTASRVVAVGSRGAESARRFADAVGAERAHASYDDLVGDPDVDVAYVATPHHLHREHALLAIEAGKHVLVEKPFTLDADSARDVAAAAVARGVFCAEALWTLFLPRYDVVRQLLADGALGDLQTVLVDHGEWFAADHRIQRPDLAGGCLWDLGVYDLAVALWAAGPATSVTAVGTDAPTGVPGQTSMVLRHPGEVHSLLSTSIFNDTPCSGVLSGSDATLTLPGPFWGPGPLELVEHGRGRRATWDEPVVRHEALYFQAAEVARRICAGERESPLRPLADTVATLEVLDEVRRQVGAGCRRRALPAPDLAER
ncbi:MAG: Gfo/Idh/MocA family oxidoreductase [Actinomycetota bacterium]|nr:Gfo/Idh/MocA family oxidoreductase [Actinomycetota bacterium]